MYAHEVARRRALDVQVERGARTREARTLLEFAELELARGKRDRAREHVDDAVEMVEAIWRGAVRPVGQGASPEK